MNSKSDKAKGHAKQAIADLTGDKNLKREGKADVAAGRVKEVVKNAAKVADKTVDKAKDKFSKH